MIMVLIFGKYADVYGLIQMTKISTIIAAVFVLISFFYTYEVCEIKTVDDQAIYRRELAFAVNARNG